MRTNVSILIGALIAVVIPMRAPSQSGGSEKWTEFRDTRGNFAVLLPGTPSRIEPGPGIVSYALTVEGIQYGVTWIPTRKLNNSEIEQAFDKSRDAGLRASGSNSRVVSERHVTLNGYPGRHMELKSDIEVGYSRMYYAEQVLYTIVIATHRKSIPPENVSKFFDSFRLLSE